MEEDGVPVTIGRDLLPDNVNEFEEGGATGGRSLHNSDAREISYILPHALTFVLVMF